MMPGAALVPTPVEFLPEATKCPPRSESSYSALRHQPHAVVAVGNVRRAADVEVIGDCDAAGDDDRLAEVGETGGIAAAGCGLQHIGGATDGRPGDQHVVAL